MKKLALESATHYLEIVSRLATSDNPHEKAVDFRLYTGHLMLWAGEVFRGYDLPSRQDFLNGLRRNAIVPEFTKMDTLLGKIPNPDLMQKQPASLLETWSWEMAIMAHEQLSGAYSNFLDSCTKSIFATPPMLLNP